MFLCILVFIFLDSKLEDKNILRWKLVMFLSYCSVSLNDDNYELTHLLTYSLHGAESFLRS